MTESHPYAITKFEVEDLFGYICQKLESDADTLDDISRLVILYGENGTGKTILLRLAFHLLSPRVDRGHKTEIARIPFKFFRVTLRDGSYLEAKRKNSEIGGYEFKIKRPKKKIITHKFVMDMGEYSIRPYEYSQELKKELTDIA